MAFRYTSGAMDLLHTLAVLAALVIMLPVIAAPFVDTWRCTPPGQRLHTFAGVLVVIVCAVAGLGAFQWLLVSLAG